MHIYMRMHSMYMHPMYMHAMHMHLMRVHNPSRPEQQPG